MRTRRLGNSDLELTVVGLGTWAAGGSGWMYGWGAQDDADSVAALLAGVRAGANWIDTAAIYGDGHAEQIVGRALRELAPGERPIVATKCSRIMQPDGSPRGCMRRDSIRRECEASLRRLGVDAIDLYQLHWPDPDAEIEAGWRALGELIEEGKVRHAGVSNFSVAQLERVQEIRPVTSLQPPYSLLRRGVENDILPWCADHDVGVVAYSPMQKGLLSGTFTAERAAALPDDDHRSRDPEFRGARLRANLRLTTTLADLAARRGHTLAELAIAWVVRRQEVTSAIVGVRSPDQIAGVIGAAAVELDRATELEIDSALTAREHALGGDG